jgi:Ca-activated chloride channel family protein
MGAGVAAYHVPNLSMAVAAFREAILLAQTHSQRASALFNLGNAYLQAGLLVEAIEAYEHSLRYEPLSQARHNLAVARARLTLETDPNRPDEESERGEPRDQDPNRSQDENAFYGGMSAGGGGPSGMDDEMEKGMRDDPSEDQWTLQGDPTDYQLSSTPSQWLTGEAGQAEAVKADQAKRRRIAVMHQALASVQDDQAGLLKRLFEREEGFQAEQEKGHALPGVMPW